ncbi:MAG: stage II sporulation protein M [Candidatus Aenigmarchaeota archaeon]|nr:stage II sporulation protein M [Candidatus Aenigmarchaeota archaeon]
MVLESLADPKNAQDKPLHVFILSFIFSFIAVFFANVMFPSESSLLSIALITIMFIPFFQKMFEIDEQKEDATARKQRRDNLWARHASTIYAFSAFFLGVVIALSMVFVFFPEFSQTFGLQSETVQRLSGSVLGSGTLDKFLFNNTQVMILVFILSFMFGAGSIFVLAWNASVISVYVGLMVQSIIKTGIAPATAYAFGLPAGLGSIALHGIPEISAYFIAGLAGGILSVGMIRENILSKEFRQILRDSLVFLAAAEVLIIVAAYIEVGL